jgi:hypothetical protein
MGPEDIGVTKNKGNEEDDYHSADSDHSEGMADGPGKERDTAEGWY